MVEAIEYIEANLFEPISTESVGKAINYAPSSFSVIFSAVAGYSVGEVKDVRARHLTQEERDAKAKTGNRPKE